MSPHARVTPREQELLRHLSKGLTNKQLATVLGIELSTVENHLHNIFRKFGVDNRTQAVITALGRGLVKVDDKPEE